MCSFASSAWCADEQEIIKVFQRYQIAVFNDNGDLALQQIDRHTKDYYQQMLHRSRYASAVESKSLSMNDRFLLVRTRHELSADELSSLDAEAYFKYSVDHEWIDKRSLSDLELVDVQISGDHASSHLQKGEQTASYGFDFNRESGQWKIDLTSVFPALEQSMRVSVERFGGEENEFILQVVGAVTRTPVDPYVWFPPLSPSAQPQQ